MSVKKSLPKAGSPFRPSKAPAMPSSLPTPPPLQVAAPVATRTENSIALGTLMICAVALLAVFGTSMMAGIVGITSTTSYWTCSESNEIGNNYVNSADIPYYSSFFTNNGDVVNTKYFDIYTSSTAQCVNGGSRVAYDDKCLIDICTGTSCKSTATSSCTVLDKNCRLQEGFIVSTSSSATLSGWYKTGPNLLGKVSNWLYYCPNGCSNGACNHDPCFFCKATQECINKKCILKQQSKRIGVIYAYESQNTHNLSWKNALISDFSKAHDALLGLSNGKINYNFDVLGEIQTPELCWNPAKIGLNYIIKVSEVNIATHQTSSEYNITVTTTLPGSDFRTKEVLINSTKKIINIDGQSYLRTEALQNINLDCPHCKISSTDRTAEYQQLFPNENYQAVSTTAVSIDCSNNIVDNKFNTPLLDSIKQRASQTLKFNLNDYDSILIVFGRLGTILPQESASNLNFRCNNAVGFTLAYSHGIFAENGLLQGGFVNCSSATGRFFDKTGWHIIVHEFLHLLGAVDIYNTGTIFSYESPGYNRAEALKIDPLADESVMGDENRACKITSQQTGVNQCDPSELERVYLDKYNGNFVGI